MFDESDWSLISSSLEKLFQGKEGQDLTVPLTEFGVDDLLASSPAQAVPLLFGLQGRKNTTSSLLNTLLVPQLAAVLPKNVKVSAVALPLHVNGRTSAGVYLDGIQMHGVCFGACAEGSLACFLEDQKRSPLLALVSPRGLLQDVRTLDPNLNISMVKGQIKQVQFLQTPDLSHLWDGVLMWARLALAAEILGAARTMLQQATDYAKQRKQFGKEIGSFQAVKHRLADTLVAIEAAEATAISVWPNPTPLGALLVKSMAGRAGKAAATHCLQVFGGIGFTWEFGFHRLQKRVLVLDRLLGSSRTLPKLIGEELIARGDAPLLAGL